MKKLSLLLLVLFLGCSPYLKNASKCVETEHSGYGFGNESFIKIEYQSYNFLLNEKKKDAQLAMNSQKELDSMINLVPKGGLIVIRFSGRTIDQADPSNYEYIMQDMNGNTLKRIKGEHSIANLRGADYYCPWYNSDVLLLSNIQAESFKFSVVSTTYTTRTSYIIYPEKENE
jgi:hypothetical protein